MNIWFTSDQHYDHRNIIKYSGRPFHNIDHMKESFIERHNSVVKPEDIIINLGDFALNELSVSPILKRLNGKHTLVCGNHDRCHSCHSHHERSILKYKGYGFVEVLQTMNMMIGKCDVLIEHMPYIDDSRHKERYQQFRPKDEGRWLFHGHVHELWKQRNRMINVGVDQWNYTPVHIDELAAMIHQ